MFVVSLQSGSNGNCYFVEADGVRLLFDAGISAIQAERRLAARGFDIRSVDALLISHDHRDHSGSLGVFQRKFGLPVYITAPTLDAVERAQCLGPLGKIYTFEAGTAMRFGSIRVETIRTPHDSADGVAFAVDDGRQRLGILTDLGHVFDGLERLIGSLDAVVLESNYDPPMLAHGPYPPHLKRRIRGPGGHLSNGEAAQLLARAANPRMHWACLAHLSEQNNHPEVALRTHREILGPTFPLHLASRYEATDVLEI